jgi:hypothetical protein
LASGFGNDFERLPKKGFERPWLLKGFEENFGRLRKGWGALGALRLLAYYRPKHLYFF